MPVRPWSVPQTIRRIMESEELETQPLRIYPFMDTEDEDDLIIELLQLDCQNCQFDFISDHWDLCEEHIVSVVNDLCSGDDELFDEAIHTLFHSNPHRTEEEIMEAHSQVWDRRWYALMPREDRLELAENDEQKEEIELGLMSREVKYNDLNDERYDSEYGQGYLAGIQSALSWVQGLSWNELDT